MEHGRHVTSTAADQRDFYRGPLLTIIALSGLEIFAAPASIADPIYLVLVAYSAARGGTLPGLLSGTLSVAHIALPLLLEHSAWSKVQSALPHLGLIALASTLVALLVGSLERKGLRSAHLAHANEELVNRAIERRHTEETARALAAMGRALVQPLDFPSVRRGIVSTVLDLFRITQAGLYELHAASEELVCVATAGEADSSQRLGKVLPQGAGVVWRAVAEGRPIWARAVSEFESSTTDSPPARDALEGFRSGIAVPLKSRGKVLGALTVAVVEGRVFTPEEIQLLSIFADYAALALENARLYSDLHEALARLTAAQQERIEDERLKALEELTAGIAHHINNRLMVILGGVQLVTPKVDEPSLQQSLDVVERTTLDTARLVDKLRRFTQVRSVPGTVSADLNAAVQQALDMTQHQRIEAGSRGIDVRIAPALGVVPRVAADQALVEEALVHVIANAIEALEDPGTITVKTWALAHDVYCSVADSGPGMTEDIRRRVTEPFFTSKGPGRTGLGLSTAYGLVRSQSGSLEIRSEVGVGTAVTIRLPGTLMLARSAEAAIFRETPS